MRLTASFDVPLPPGEAWEVLQDIERVAPWFPGARLDAASGEGFSGTVRVKLGPMMVDYRGSARFLERDAGARRVVIEASGREQRGAGTATARAETSLAPSGDGTAVEVVVDLDVTGRPAQLGQGLMQDVAERVVAEFASRMRADLSSGAGASAEAAAVGGAGAGAAGGGAGTGGSGAASRGSEGGPARRGATASAPQSQAWRASASSAATSTGDVLDLGRVAGPALVRRAAVPALTALLGALLGGWIVQRVGRRAARRRLS